jgi:hypothetical protein
VNDIKSSSNDFQNLLRLTPFHEFVDDRPFFVQNMLSVAGVTKKLAYCGRFEGRNFHQETIPLDMVELVNRQFFPWIYLSI